MRRKQVARTYVIEKKELDIQTCPTCDKTFIEGEESLSGLVVTPAQDGTNKKYVHNPRLKKLWKCPICKV